MSLFFETAESIGARLCRDAFWSGPRCTWIGASMDGLGDRTGKRPAVRNAFGPEIYSGTSGVGILLAELASLNGERIFRKTAEAAAAHAVSRLEDMPAADRIGFYTGRTGIAYALVRMGNRLGNSHLIEKGIAAMESLGTLDLTEQRLDVVGGVAGAIPPLLLFHRIFGKQRFLDLAVQCADRLKDSARRSEEGCSWKTTESHKRDLTGFSHGAAGIAWALLELSVALNERRYRDLAEDGFRYERCCFDRAEANWPDFRSNLSSQKTEVYGVAWCHGAPGICLTRLRSLELTADVAYADEAAIAAQTTLGYFDVPNVMQEDFSLCHGGAGNAEILVESTRCLGKADYRESAEQLAAEAAEWFESGRAPWPCGVPGTETASLFLGTAGIGLFYLRLHDSSLVPSILMVSPAQADCLTGH